MSASSTITVDGKNDRAAGQDRHDRAERHRHRQALRPDRRLHLRSRLHLDRQLRVEDHLHRRRRGRAALSRLPDRAAGRARRLPRDLLPAALRRAADRRPEGRFRLPRHAPHHGARADEPVLHRLPPRRAPDGGDGRLASARSRPSITTRPTSRTEPAHDRVDAHDRQDADARRDGLQVLDRPALRVSEERPRLHVELPAHVLRGAVRGVQGQPGASRGRWTGSSSCTPTTSRTPRPRRCGSPARRAPTPSPASRPASPACGARPMAAPTRRR